MGSSVLSDVEIIREKLNKLFEKKGSMLDDFMRITLQQQRVYHRLYDNLWNRQLSRAKKFESQRELTTVLGNLHIQTLEYKRELNRANREIALLRAGLKRLQTESIDCEE